jgi:hypothetical protein
MEGRAVTDPSPIPSTEHADTVAKYALGACELRVTPWPYDCASKDKHPEHVVTTCMTHATWWHTAPAVQSTPVLLGLRESAALDKLLADLDRFAAATDPHAVRCDECDAEPLEPCRQSCTGEQAALNTLADRLGAVNA